MIMTKAEAKRRGITEDQICVFHDLYPDQSALKGYQDCIIIRDSCGCDRVVVILICRAKNAIQMLIS